MYLGEIFAFAVSGYLAETRIMWGDLNVGGWPSIFVWFGLLGVVWFPFFVMTVHSTPSEHPTITREEIAIIYQGEALLLTICFFLNTLAHFRQGRIRRLVFAGGGGRH
jgi:uncharacterized metal-binding protein